MRGAGALRDTDVYRIAVPENVSFIARDAFPRPCAVTLIVTKSDAEFSEWKRVGQSG
jgi:hypothetical protein